MTIPCEIIRDLLFLYADDACSPESRKAVEEHLAQCPGCRRHMEAVKLPDIMSEAMPEPDPVVQERVIKNGFRRLRRRWLRSVLAVFLLFPLLLLGMMGVHEYLGEGIAFTNLYDIFVSKRFMNLIENQRFEAAAGLLDFESMQEEFARKAKDQFVRTMETYYSDGVTIRDPRFYHAYRIDRHWRIIISGTLQYPTGQSFLIEYNFILRDGKLNYDGHSHIERPPDFPVSEALELFLPVPEY